MGVDYKYCPYCGQETYEQGARYCPSCGKAYPNVNISPDNRNENSYSNEVTGVRFAFHGYGLFSMECRG